MSVREISVSRFCAEKNINSKQKRSLLNKTKNLPRKKRRNLYIYRYEDLENLWEKDFLRFNAPDGYITTSAFFKKHIEYRNIGDLVSTQLSHLALTGQIKRIPLNEGGTRFAYLEADILKSCKDYEKQPIERRTQKKYESELELPIMVEPITRKGQTKMEYHPGIFVRLWRWLFGYRKEVRA